MPAPCTLECAEGKLVLWVHPGNLGASPVTTITTVEVLGLVNGNLEPLASVDVPDVIEPGEYLDAVKLEVDPLAADSLTIRVSVKEQECDLGNNEVVLAGPFCG